MGGGYSGPIPKYGEDFEFVVMTMQKYGKFIIMHAPSDVVNAVRDILK